MRAFVCGLGLAALSALPAFAQYANDSPQYVLARQVVSDLVTPDRIEQIGDSFLPTIINQLKAHGLKVTPAAVAGIRLVMHDEMQTVIDESLSDLAQAYAASFSADELKSVADFYASEAGKKLVAQEPGLMAKVLPNVASRLQADMPALRGKIQTVFNSLPPGDK